MDVRLYMGDQPSDTSGKTIPKMFSQAETAVFVSRIEDRATGYSEGFAFVEMRSQKEAQNAISTLNAHSLGDRQMTVSVARPREERGSFQHRGGGHGDRNSRGSGRGY